MTFFQGVSNYVSVMIRASLRFEIILNFLINPRKKSIFYWSFSNQSEALVMMWEGGGMIVEYERFPNKFNTISIVFDNLSGYLVL